MDSKEIAALITFAVLMLTAAGVVVGAFQTPKGITPWEILVVIGAVNVVIAYIALVAWATHSFIGK